jgi:penicillin-binding protein 2B
VDEQMNRKVKLRSIILGGVCTLFFLCLIGRLYWVQIVEASELMEKAEKNWEENKILSPVRGTIYDRNGEILAQDATAYTVAVNPKLINEQGLADEVVEGLAPILNMTIPEKKQKLYSLVTARQSDGSFYLQREIRNEGWKISQDVAEQIRRLIEKKNWAGVYLLEDQKRYYPADELAAHVLGYTDKEGNAIMGLEMYYDEYLRGIPGEIHYERDLLGYELPNAKVQYKPAVDGKSLRLTIDENIQLILEQAIQKAYDQYAPKHISAVAVDPRTMELLGMAVLPNFNPNEYWRFSSFQDFFNVAVGAQYEPGSTFKIVTLAAAVEEGLFNPNETYRSGVIYVRGTPIKDHNNGQGWGEITYLEGLKRSSNVAFVKLGYERLGGEKLRDYILNFGFGAKTGIDLPGETAGIIDFKYDTEIATATFGQGKVAVTAIQQIAAVSAIANGGKLMRPYIVKEIIDPKTNQIVTSFSPQVIRQVVSEETARKVAEYLEQVVSDQSVGSGWRAYIEGYRIAGKTGTAQKVINGRYAEGKYVVSFIGFAPVENPQIAVIVIADEPELNGDYRLGGEVVGPVFKEIMGNSLRYLGVSNTAKESKQLPPSRTLTVPDVKHLSVSAAENKLLNAGLNVELLGHGANVVSQFPETGTETVQGQRIYLLTSQPENIEIPDLTGKSMRDALQVCSLLELECEVEGEGYVSGQTLTSRGGSRVLQLVFSPPQQFLQKPEEEDAEQPAEDGAAEPEP